MPDGGTGESAVDVPAGLARDVRVRVRDLQAPAIGDVELTLVPPARGPGRAAAGPPDHGRARCPARSSRRTAPRSWARSAPFTGTYAIPGARRARRHRGGRPLEAAGQGHRGRRRRPGPVGLVARARAVDVRRPGRRPRHRERPDRRPRPERDLRRLGLDRAGPVRDADLRLEGRRRRRGRRDGPPARPQLAREGTSPRERDRLRRQRRRDRRGRRGGDGAARGRAGRAARGAALLRRRHARRERVLRPRRLRGELRLGPRRRRALRPHGRVTHVEHPRADRRHVHRAPEGDRRPGRQHRDDPAAHGRQPPADGRPDRTAARDPRRGGDVRRERLGRPRRARHHVRLDLRRRRGSPRPPRRPPRTSTRRTARRRRRSRSPTTPARPRRPCCRSR